LSILSTTYLLCNQIEGKGKALIIKRDVVGVGANSIKHDKAA
jgi:hypothetical protein